MLWRPKILLLLPLLQVAACTTPGDGQGYANLSASLWSRFAGLESGAGRVGADGWFKTDNSFELKLGELQLTVRELRLLRAGSKASGARGDCGSFDPQNPPAGCTLCHGGHCHCDNKLVSYEELRTRACSGSSSSGAAMTTLATLPLGAAQSLLGKGSAVDLSTCQPSCELVAGQLERLQLRLERMVLRATLRDRSLADRLGGKQLLLDLDWKLAGAALEHTLTSAQKIDRDTPYRLDLTVELPVVRTLLDGIDWHKLIRENGRVKIDSKSNTSTGEALSTNLAKSKLAASVKRWD